MNYVEHVEKKAKYLELLPNDKFTDSYVDFVSKNFDSNDHMFIVIGKGIDSNIKETENVKRMVKMKIRHVSFLLKEMYKCEKVFLHGLFHKEIVLLLFVQPWLLQKSTWFIWGGDLYWYKFRNRNLKSNLYAVMRKFVIKNMGGLVTHIKGDYELARLWYGAKGKYYYSFMYPSNLFKEYNLPKADRNNKRFYVQVGNSADPTNNHIDVFNKLIAYRDKVTEIICPLSYGNVEYRNRVIKMGFEIFGKRFTPIIEFMPFSEYLKLLAKIDVAIFNHGRQQAMGNIITLLGLGKKVYIRDDITTWEFFKLHGLTLYNINGNFTDLKEPIPINIRSKNIEKIKSIFSEDKLKEQLQKIFSDNIKQ